MIHNLLLNSSVSSFMFTSVTEKYFDMNKKQCREALDIYKKFLSRTDRVIDFLKVAEVCGAQFDIDGLDIE